MIDKHYTAEHPHIICPAEDPVAVEQDINKDGFTVGMNWSHSDRNQKQADGRWLLYVEPLGANVTLGTTYLEGLRITALNAINCQAYSKARDLLDLGLSYAYGMDFPEEAEPLLDAKLALDTCEQCILHPERFTATTDTDKLWQDSLTEARKFLGDTTP